MTAFIRPKRLEVIFMGVGSSGGTPVIACSCPSCLSAHPRNRRTRCSAHLVADGVHLQIDTGPDFRAQCLRERIDHIDAVLYTHQHADHLNGIDDLRALCYRQKSVIPVYGPAFTMADIERRFAYALQPPSGHWERPALSVNPVEQCFDVQGISIVPITVMHGQWPILGYRVGDFAWLTDVSDIPQTSLPLLEGVRVIALDCLRERPHPTHLSRQQALDWAKRIGAETTYLIHMTHELDYEQGSADLPPSVIMAWDGLRIVLEA